MLKEISRHFFWSGVLFPHTNAVLFILPEWHAQHLPQAEFQSLRLPVPVVRVIAKRFLNLFSSCCISFCLPISNEGWSMWVPKSVFINSEWRNWLSLECVAQDVLKPRPHFLCNLNAPIHHCQDFSIMRIKSLHWIMKGLYPRSYLPHLCLT